jgi:hypothetical protein
MFDGHDKRQDVEDQEYAKAHQEFLDNFNDLVTSITDAKTNLNKFYSENDLHFLNENNRVFHSMTRLQVYTDEFMDQWKQVPDVDGPNYKSGDHTKHLKEKFIPYALSFFKILQIQSLSIQPIILMKQTFNDASKNFYGPIDERITAINENEDIGPLEFDREGWNNAYNDYDNAKVAWGDANVAIIKNWDPWTETDIHAILDDYAKVTGAMYSAGNKFIKHLEKVEKLLEKIWEIRKTAELTAQVQGGANQEPDNFAKIEKLARLFQSGAITEAEFASKKAELLKSIE